MSRWERLHRVLLGAAAMGLLALSIVAPNLDSEADRRVRRVQACGEILELVSCDGMAPMLCKVITEHCGLIKDVPRVMIMDEGMVHRLTLIKEGEYIPTISYHCVDGGCVPAAECRSWMPCFHF